MRIEAKNLIKIYGDRSVVNDVTFDINKGEVVCLLGPNGAGKTTTFYMVVGLVKPNKGHIFLDGEDISAWPMNERAKAGIGYLPQEASIFRKLSVEDNIKLVLEMNDKLTVNEKKRKLEELLTEFGILKLRSYAAVSLSGGERRRVEIARALAASPDFMLLDEPFAGIDPIAIGDIKDKDCYMVDDMIDTARSAVNGARALKASGARSVKIAAVHGVFSNPAYELLSSGIFDEILVTDSIPLSEKMLSLPFVHVVSLSPMLAQVITRIATDQPLSLIYETYGDNGTINNKHLVTKK